ncbi:hypothetical protein VP01_3036g1 [Puccinia sorghi]|uniref:Uncharacterized protein n=1 Tax=Puccinia sorghi TaxID=27349 RepID=A0A0L6V044_9BASI|nr:hypothetical protein VP01_3036g1 [Puccinia sorghi]
MSGTHFESIPGQVRMIYPNLEEYKAENSINVVGPSVSNAVEIWLQQTNIGPNQSLQLILLPQSYSSTLKKLTKHVKNNHDIIVLPGAIQKMLKTICVTWKSVTPIPCKWNEAAFLQQCPNYVTGLRFENKCKGFYDKSFWKKTGITATNVCKFLKIKIEFLPKYSPFLNPINLAFNIIKINVKHKDIPLKKKKFSTACS